MEKISPSRALHPTRDCSGRQLTTPMMNANLLMRQRAEQRGPPTTLTHAQKEARVFALWGKSTADMAANVGIRLADYMLERASSVAAARGEENGVHGHNFRPRDHARELGRGTVVAKPYVPRAVFKGGGQLQRAPLL